jgi:hypothetical protein
MDTAQFLVVSSLGLTAGGGNVSQIVLSEYSRRHQQRNRRKSPANSMEGLCASAVSQGYPKAQGEASMGLLSVEDCASRVQKISNMGIRVTAWMIGGAGDPSIESTSAGPCWYFTEAVHATEQFSPSTYWATCKLEPPTVGTGSSTSTLATNSSPTRLPVTSAVGTVDDVSRSSSSSTSTPAPEETIPQDPIFTPGSPEPFDLEEMQDRRFDHFLAVVYLTIDWNRTDVPVKHVEEAIRQITHQIHDNDNALGDTSSLGRMAFTIWDAQIVVTDMSIDQKQSTTTVLRESTTSSSSSFSSTSSASSGSGSTTVEKSTPFLDTTTVSERIPTEVARNIASTTASSSANDVEWVDFPINTENPNGGRFVEEQTVMADIDLAMVKMNANASSKGIYLTAAVGVVGLLCVLATVLICIQKCQKRRQLKHKPKHSGLREADDGGSFFVEESTEVGFGAAHKLSPPSYHTNSTIVSSETSESNVDNLAPLDRFMAEYIQDVKERKKRSSSQFSRSNMSLPKSSPSNPYPLAQTKTSGSLFFGKAKAKQAANPASFRRSSPLKVARRASNVSGFYSSVNIDGKVDSKMDSNHGSFHVRTSPRKDSDGSSFYSSVNLDAQPVRLLSQRSFNLDTVMKARTPNSYRMSQLYPAAVEEVRDEDDLESEGGAYPTINLLRKARNKPVAAVHPEYILSSAGALAFEHDEVNNPEYILSSNRTLAFENDDSNNPEYILSAPGSLAFETDADESGVDQVPDAAAVERVRYGVDQVPDAAAVERARYLNSKRKTKTTRSVKDRTGYILTGGGEFHRTSDSCADV